MIQNVINRIIQANIGFSNRVSLINSSDTNISTAPIASFAQTLLQSSYPITPYRFDEKKDSNYATYEVLQVAELQYDKFVLGYEYVFGLYGFGNTFSDSLDVFNDLTSQLGESTNYYSTSAFDVEYINSISMYKSSAKISNLYIPNAFLFYPQAIVVPGGLSSNVASSIICAEQQGANSFSVVSIAGNIQEQELLQEELFATLFGYSPQINSGGIQHISSDYFEIGCGLTAKAHEYSLNVKSIA